MVSRAVVNYNCTLSSYGEICKTIIYLHNPTTKNRC